MSDTFSTRAYYWADALKSATTAANAWHNENVLLGWGDSVSLVMEQVERYVALARRSIQNPQSFKDVRDFDAQMRTYVESIYAQIKTPAPKWTDPVWETLNDLRDGAKEVAQEVGKPIAFGAGAALVLVGALYLLSRKL